ncbi:MAG: beta/gamma crystallin-related protein [Asticcacaulis sp.]
MKKFLYVASASLALCMAAFTASAQSRGSITLYEGYDYSGRSVTLNSDESNLLVHNFNDAARSARVSGTWQICEHVNYRGRCVTLTGDTPNLDTQGFGAQASSAVRTGGGGGWDGGGRPNDGREGITLYEHADFQGRSITLTRDEFDLTSRGFNDAASSAIVNGPAWELCDDAGFRGQCRIVSGRVSNFGGLGLNDRVSSARDARGNSGGGRPEPSRDTITLYEHDDFQGRSITLTREEFDLNSRGFNDAASSVRVSGGAWEVCDDAGFRGNCRILTGSVRSLGAMGLNDKVSSVRPERRGGGGQGGSWNGGGNWGGDGYGSGPGYGNDSGTLGYGSITLYEGTYYSGRSLTLTGPIANLDWRNFNDRAMSARIRGTWQLCSDADYRNCNRFDRDLPDLGRVGLPRNLSSVRPR